MENARTVNYLLPGVGYGTEGEVYDKTELLDHSVSRTVKR